MREDDSWNLSIPYKQEHHVLDWYIEFSTMNDDWCLPIYCSTGSMFVAKNNTTQCHKYIPYSHTVKMKIATVWWEMLNIMESIQLQSSITPTRK